MSDNPKDDEKSIMRGIWEGLASGCWTLFKIVFVIGLVIWVQQHPDKAGAIVNAVADGVAYLFHAAADALAKPEAVPNTL